MAQYMDCSPIDHSGIIVEFFENISPISYPSKSIPLSTIHKHRSYELTLILRGSCEHFYRNIRTPLIPGDLFLIPPDHSHAYRFEENSSICTCIFHPEVLTHAFKDLFNPDEHTDFNNETISISEKHLKELKAFEAKQRAIGNPTFSKANNIQGIIHLSNTETSRVYSIMKNILQEQTDQSFGFERMKKTLLEQLLTIIKRIQIQQFYDTYKEVSWKQDMIDAVLTKIDEDISRNIDFKTIAQQQGITLSYFRTIFKTVTGLSPTDFLNRIRILKALQLLQATDYPVSEIAMMVGIYDANYFSRLFKKIIGHPPTYYKSISSYANQDI